MHNEAVAADCELLHMNSCGPEAGSDVVETMPDVNESLKYPMWFEMLLARTPRLVSIHSSRTKWDSGKARLHSHRPSHGRRWERECDRIGSFLWTGPER